MFAFENWHSVVEVKRYMERFMHLIAGMNQLKGILHTEYNQYDSLILPLLKWLSFTMTFTDDDIVFPYLLDLTGDLPGMGGVVTIKDSNWMMSWTAPKQPHFINQPENVKLL